MYQTGKHILDIYTNLSARWQYKTRGSCEHVPDVPDWEIHSRYLLGHPTRPKIERQMTVQDKRNDDTSHCDYFEGRTHEYDSDDFDFSSSISMQTHNQDNPIVFNVDKYQGVRYKIDVIDDDVAVNGNDDQIDKYRSTKTPTRSLSASTATWTSYTLTGQRTKGSPTTLKIRQKVYCSANYYSKECDVYCVARDDTSGHYTCDPETGDKNCRHGWKGSSCTIPECESTTCLNNAVCRDTTSGFECICPRGYEGDLCGEDIDECASNPCSNNGVCTDSLDDYTCDCSSLYVGDNCQHHICDHPTEVQCYNGGTCFSDGSCECPDAYEGSDCQTYKCDSLTCLNGGTCQDGLCNCVAGYTGTLCGVEICTYKACYNGASCEDGVCLCATGYTGDSCHINIDDCVSDPCLNDASCHDRVNAYVCQCLPDYYGVHCEYQITTTTTTAAPTTTTAAPTTTTAAPTTTTAAPTTTTAAPTTTTAAPTTTTAAPTTTTVTTSPTIITSTLTSVNTTTSGSTTQTSMISTTKRNPKVMMSQSTLDDPKVNGVIVSFAVVLLIVIIIIVAFCHLKRKKKASQSQHVIPDASGNFENPLYSEMGAAGFDNNYNEQTKHNMFATAREKGDMADIDEPKLSMSPETGNVYYIGVPPPAYEEAGFELPPPYQPRASAMDEDPYALPSDNIRPLSDLGGEGHYETPRRMTTNPVYAQVLRKQPASEAAAYAEVSEKRPLEDTYDSPASGKRPVDDSDTYDSLASGKRPVDDSDTYDRLASGKRPVEDDPHYDVPPSGRRSRAVDNVYEDLDNFNKSDKSDQSKA